MFDSFLKKFKDDLMGMLIAIFPLWVTPNQITLIGFLFGVLSAYLVSVGLLTAGFYCWLLNRILDGFDGVVARKRDKQSDFGGYIDLVCDTIIYSLIPLGFSSLHNDKMVYKVCIYMISTFFVNMTAMMYCTALVQQKKYDLIREKNEQENKKQLNSIFLFVGLIEGFETMVVYTLFFLFPQSLFALFSIFSVGCTIMIIQRILYAKTILCL